MGDWEMHIKVAVRDKALCSIKLDMVVDKPVEKLEMCFMTYHGQCSFYIHSMFTLLLTLLKQSKEHVDCTESITQ